jgi:hypothetical protein
MEVYLALSLLGLGIYLNKDGIVDRKRPLVNVPSQNPNANSIYDTKRFKKVLDTEQKLSDQIYEKRKINDVQPPLEKITSNNFNKIDSLTGEQISSENFNHNNMVPYFGGKVRQSTYEFANKPLLENFTGVGDTFKNKREQKNMFNPSKDSGNINGSGNATDFYLERTVTPTIRNNVLPFEQVRVGPGINNGYNAEPKGGFQQLDTRDYVMPKTVDQLRVLSNPKTTFEGRVIAGHKSLQRGKIGAVEKNLPEKYFENCPDRYFTTVGAYTRNTQRPKEIIRDTNRIDTHKEYIGAGTSVNKKTQSRPNIKKTTNNTYRDTGLRNANARDKWAGDGDEINDYGKKNIIVYNTERQNTESRTYESNVGSLVKAIIAPLEDVFRVTGKENMIEAPRKFGNVSVNIPNKLTVYDPNDIARTTIKETNIHDDRIGNASMPKKLTIYDPNDIARTTIKETNIHDTRIGNIAVYQTSEFRDPDMVAKTTTKETVNMDDVLNLVGNSKNKVYDPNDIAKTTIKETNIHDTRVGNINRAVLENGDAYTVTEYDAKPTNKQFLSDNEYTGIASSANDKPMSYSDIYNASLNQVKEELIKGRSPTNTSVKLNIGEEDINMEIRKIEADELNPHEGNKNKLYQNIPTNIPCNITTDKVSLSNQINDDRLDGTLLDAFKNNPFTQSLNSYA